MPMMAKPTFVFCLSCGGRTAKSETEAEAFAAWNRRAQPENKPLTPDELREMDGEPVWVHEVTAEPIDGDYWAIIDANVTCAYDYGSGAAISPATDGKSRFAHTPFSDYGKTWLAYRSKPEEVQNER